VVSGFGKFIAGVFKAAVFGGRLSVIFMGIMDFRRADVSVLSSWVLMLVFALAVYFLLSGFADIAQGLCLMFGISLPRNFYYPYQSRSVTDFYERFLMTVGHFIKRRTGGISAEPLRLTVCWLLLGLWFGPLPGFLLWAAYCAAITLFERYFFRRVLDALPTLFCRVYALCAILAGFVFLAGNNIAGGLLILRDMLSFIFMGGRIPLYNARIMYELSTNWIVIIAACFFATNLVDVAGRGFAKIFPRVSKAGSAVISLCILALYTALAV
jgi:alginate O-acetyltransferase complex protein AlgI